MPTYSYECGACGIVTDVFHGMSEAPKIKCETCGKKCQRLIGTGAGIIFKGSGFYETDFKEKKGKAPEKSGSESKSEPKSESKPESAAEKKPTAPAAPESARTSSAKASSARKKAANN